MAFLWILLTPFLGWTTSAPIPPPALDIYDQRIFDGQCPMVDCYMVDMLLQCPFKDREFVFFNLNGIECRGCRRCRREVPTTTPRTPTSSSTSSSTSTELRTSADAVDEETQTWAISTNDGISTSNDVMETESEIDTTSQATTTDSWLEADETGVSDVTPTLSDSEEYDPLKRFRKKTLMRGWVDEDGLLSFGDDDAMMDEFVHEGGEGDILDDESGAKASPVTEKSTLRDSQDSKQRSGARDSNSTSSGVSPSVPAASRDIQENCPLLDCETIEYYMECSEEDRVQTFRWINGVKCEGCRRCRGS